MTQRLNGLWIGLNLLGVYFLITGLADVACALQQWAVIPDAGEVGGITKQDVFRVLIRSGVTAVGGLALLLTADFYAPLWRDRKPVPPGSD